MDNIKKDSELTIEEEILKQIKKIVKHAYLGTIINRELPIDCDLWGISEIVCYTGYQYDDIKKLTNRSDFPKKVMFKNLSNEQDCLKFKDRWFSKDIKEYLNLHNSTVGE